MKKISIIIFLSAFSYLNVVGQECKENIINYFDSLDTTKREVYLVVDKRPEILENNELGRLIMQSEVFNGLNCCPFKVYIGLVIEPDSSISNIQICTKMMFCSEETDIESETVKFNDRLEKFIKNIKSSPGLKNGEKVAVSVIIPIHLDCQ